MVTIGYSDSYSITSTQCIGPIRKLLPATKRNRPRQSLLLTVSSRSPEAVSIQLHVWFWYAAFDALMLHYAGLLLIRCFDSECFSGSVNTFDRTCRHCGFEFAVHCKYRTFHLEILNFSEPFWMFLNMPKYFWTTQHSARCSVRYSVSKFTCQIPITNFLSHTFGMSIWHVWISDILLLRWINLACSNVAWVVLLEFY